MLFRRISLVLSLLSFSAVLAACDPQAAERESDVSSRSADEAQQQRLFDTWEADQEFVRGLEMKGQSELFRHRFGFYYDAESLISWIEHRVVRMFYTTDRRLLPVFENEVVALDSRTGRIHRQTRVVSRAVAVNLDIEGRRQNNPDLRRAIAVGDMFFSRTSIGRFSTILHEARHSDGDDNHTHAICPSTGVPGCEKDGSGSYSMAATFQRELILHCTNCGSIADEVMEMYLDNLSRHLDSSHVEALSQGIDEQALQQFFAADANAHAKVQGALLTLRALIDRGDYDVEVL